MSLEGLVRIVAVVAGKEVVLGEVVAATLETIARIVEKPAVNPATGDPITPEDVLEELAKAKATFDGVTATIDQELERLEKG